MSGAYAGFFKKSFHKGMDISMFTLRSQKWFRLLGKEHELSWCMPYQKNFRTSTA